MMVKRFVAVACALGLGLMVGACSSFSDAVADHWPHFAGGEPNGLPPRPGEPGYNKFIAHGQPQQSAASPAGSAPPATAAQPATVTNSNPSGASQSPTAFTEPGPDQPPAAAPPGNDPGVAHGGWY
jgi:hypothetical protein